MPVSLTCSCGVRLEIDDKFAGQVIRCPDCHRELTTTAEAPRPLRTSGLGIAGLVLALAGAFTLIGPLLAIICASLSLRRQARQPHLVGGRNYARAGIVLGLLFALLSVAAYLSPELLGVDGLFREIQWASQLDFPADLRVGKENSFSLIRASSAWGVFRHSGKNNFSQKKADDEQAQFDDQILVKPRDDAQVACMTILERVADPDDLVDEALRRFESSELLTLLAGPDGKRPRVTADMIRDKKKPEGKGSIVQEMFVDLKLGGFPRTFLLQVIKLDALDAKVLAAGTRQSRFPRLEAELRKILDSFEGK